MKTTIFVSHELTKGKVNNVTKTLILMERNVNKDFENSYRGKTRAQLDMKVRLAKCKQHFVMKRTVLRWKPSREQPLIFPGKFFHWEKQHFSTMQHRLTNLIHSLWTQKRHVFRDVEATCVYTHTALNNSAMWDYKWVISSTRYIHSVCAPNFHLDFINNIQTGIPEHHIHFSTNL